MGRPKNMFLRKCPVCGKMFWCDNYELWVYKKGYRNRTTGKVNVANSIIFCSYHCMREYEKRKAETVRHFNNIAAYRGD